ncbi:Conserved hypothetical protein [Geobacillus thermodenitrificans NG80-2]|uniref:YhzD-like protein n=4 Tax=Geobacillus TaxID=129337 RepID=A4IKT2_GEOTN|nr:Conserved hypothetical protein [Geobacillus thermodenitrificans NG80-2]
MNHDSAKGDVHMPTYTLTAFERNGEKLLDETFEAANDEEAKKIGEQKLRERGCFDKTHRCVNASGKLILFHR